MASPYVEKQGNSPSDGDEYIPTYLPISLSPYLPISLHTNTYQYIPIHTNTYQYIQICPKVILNKSSYMCQYQI